VPEDTSAVVVSWDTSSVLIDTGAMDSGNAAPSTTITAVHTGTWNLTPAGGPYTAVEGTLSVVETRSDAERSECDFSYSVTGEAVSDLCDGCTEAYRVGFAFDSGNANACSDPDLPALNDRRTFGWSPDEGVLYWDYEDTDAWVPWYEVSRADNAFTLSWTATWGVPE
jgi:hypothetical protein